MFNVNGHKICADHLAGKETSLNPLGLVEALICAMQHSAELNPGEDSENIIVFTNALRQCIHTAMVEGKGTRDLCGDAGLTTEEFVDHIAEQLSGSADFDRAAKEFAQQKRSIEREGSFEPNLDSSVVDNEAMRLLFNRLDLDGNGSIDFDEFTRGITKLGIAPRKHLNKFE